MTIDMIVKDIRMGLGKDLCNILDSPGWTDVMLNEDGRLWIDRGQMEEVFCRTDENGIRSAALVLASYTHHEINEKNASFCAVIPQMNLRVIFSIPPIVKRPTAVFRRPSGKVYSMEQMISFDTISPSRAEFLKTAVKDSKNIIMAGGTGCHEPGQLIRMADSSLKKVEDIKAKDRIMGEKGDAKTVTSLHRGTDDMYTIIPDGKPEFTVNAGHILPLINPLGLVSFITVFGYLNIPDHWKQGHFLYDDKGRKYSFKVKKKGRGDYYGFSLNKNRLYTLDSGLVMHNSGKTTFLNTLLEFIPGDQRPFIIEDIEEISCRIENKAHVLVNPDYSYAQAVRDALRSRPDRIIVGECLEGDQTLQMLKAWNTGHPGGLATIHATSAYNAIRRLDQLCQEVCASSQSEMIKDAIDIVAYMKRENDGKRRITEIIDLKNDLKIS